MRWSRVLVLYSVVGLALLAAGWRFSASQHSARARPTAMALGQVSIPDTLRQQLQPYLALASRPPRRSLPVPPLPSLGRGAPPLRADRAAQGGSCYVAAGACSLIPCLEFARSTNVQVSAPARSDAFSSHPSGEKGITSAAGSGCQRRLGVPKIIRVAAP
jgi:hypothetical protein